jgi:biopolymer transport protein ExbD
MNMFVILIPFLVTMAVFTHLAMLRFALPSDVGSAQGGNGQKPQLKLTVVVESSFLAITYGETLLDSLPLATESVALEHLTKALSARRQSGVDSAQAVVAVNDAVDFGRVVRVMDAVRSAGFSGVGLSAAPPRSGKGV